LIAWSDDTDVDLEVTDPKGGQARTGAVSSSGLIKDRDCPGRDERRCRGVNAENVVLAANRELESGEYVVVVRLAPHQEPKAPVVVNLSGRLGTRAIAATVRLTPAEPQRVFVWSL
jgi:tRNA (guanosine-2'-O-)-methyltransferase